MGAMPTYISSPFRAPSRGLFFPPPPLLTHCYALGRMENMSYHFYKNNSEVFNHLSCDVVFPYDAGGVSPEKAFKVWDSTGKILPTTCPDDVHMAIAAKRSILMHLRMWGEGLEDFQEPISYYLKLFNGPVPKWVGKTLLNYAQGSMRRKEG